MRFIEVPALITEDIEDPNIVDITETETVTASINGTTLTIDGDSKVSGEVTITLTGDVTVNAVTVSNIKQPSIHKIIIKTNGTGNFTYVPNGDVTASSVSTTTKTGSDLDILLITTSGGDTYLDLDVADYVSPAANFSNVLTGFNVSDLTSAYGTTAKLYKPNGTLLTTVNSPATGSGVNFGYTETEPGDVIYKLEVTDDLGRKSKYNLPRKWINYAMETTSTPGFEKLALEGNEYTSTVTVPYLSSSSKARIHKTTDHGYMGIKFKIQGRNSTDDAWTDIANADEDDEVLAFGDYTYQRVWVKPTAKATTTVSSSNVVTLTLSNVTEDVTTKTITGMDPFEIDETSNVFVFEEPAKIGTVPFTVTLGTETYTNAVTATTEEVSTVPNTDFSTSNAIFTYGTSGGNQAAMIFGSDDANYLCVYNPADGEQMFVYKGDPSTGSYALYGGTNGDGIYRHADYVADATPLEGSAMSWDGKYMLLKKYYRGDLTIFKNNESTSTYDQLIANHTATEATTASWGASAFIPNSYDFVMTRHAYNDYGFRVVYFENSGDTWTEKWTWENPNSGGLTHSNSDTKWGRFGFQFSKDKKYAALTSYANPTSVAVLKVDLENTTTQNKFEKIWEEGITQGYACAMSPDGKYIIAGNQKIFKNNDAGDWTTKTEVQSEFTNNTIFTDYCIFLGDKYVAGGNTSSKHLFEFYPKKEVTLTFANPTLTLTGQNVTISSAKLYKDDVLFHTYGTESNVVLRSDQTGTYQAIVNDVYYSNRITPDFTTTRSVSAPQLEFDGYNKLTIKTQHSVTEIDDEINFDTAQGGDWIDVYTKRYIYLSTDSSGDYIYWLWDTYTGDAGAAYTWKGVSGRRFSAIYQIKYSPSTREWLDEGSNNPTTLTKETINGVEYIALYNSASLTAKFVNPYITTGGTSTSTTLGLPDGTTRDLTTQSNVYIYKSGTYTANVQSTDTFAYLSNVVNEVSTPVISPFTSTQNDINITGGTENPARYYKFDTLNSNSSKLFYENYTISNDVHNINKGISFYYDANDNLVVNHNDTNGSGDPGAIENVTTSSGFLNSGVINASPGDIIRGRPGDNTSTLRVQYTVPTFNQGTPSLTFDGFNKLSIENITQTSSTLKYGSNIYDTNTASNVYVTYAGEYTLEARDANTFVTSNVYVGAVDTQVDYTNLTSMYYGGAVTDVNGVLYTWGHNGYGDSGRGASDRIPTAITTISEPVSNVWRGTPGYTVAAKTSTDKWYMWGRNTYSAVLGNTTNTGNVTVPEDVTAKVAEYFGDQTVSANKILKIVMGEHHAVALTAGGKVWSWGGDATYYATGTGTNDNTVLVTPVQLNRSPPISGQTGYEITNTNSAVSTLKIRANGSIFTFNSQTCWYYDRLAGSNNTWYTQQLGYVPSTNTFIEASISGNPDQVYHNKTSSNVTKGSITVPPEGILLSNDPSSWDGGALFANPFTSTSDPLMTGITEIQTTYSGTAALDSSGNVWFWGGANTSMQYAYPTKLLDSTSIPGIVGLRATNKGTLYAWKSDGTFYTRGFGGYGVLANGADSDQYTSWQTVTTLQGKTIKKVFGGNETMFAWTDDGVYGVGRGNNYKLANGSTSNRNIWHKSTTLSALSIKEIDFGHATGLVLTTDGKGYMWGEDASNSMANALSGHQSGAAEATSISALTFSLPLLPTLTYDGYNKLSIDNVSSDAFTNFPTSIPITAGNWTGDNFVKTSTSTSTVLYYDYVGGSYATGTTIAGIEFRANSTGFTVHVLTDDNTDPNQLTVNGGSSTTSSVCAVGDTVRLYRNGSPHLATITVPDFYASSVESTYTIKKDGAAFATTTSNTVYIRNAGTYTAEVKGSGAYVTELSKVVTGEISILSEYISEYGTSNYSTYNGANNAGWTMDEWSLRPLRWNRGDRNNSLYVPVPASSSDPFAIDTMFHFYVQSLVANGFSSSSENFPFPTKNGVLWEVDMKNIELSCYNNGSRVTGSSLESTYGLRGNTFFVLQCNKNSANEVTIYIYYNRTSSTGKIFDFWWSISNTNNNVNNNETICLIQNVDLSNDTVLKYGWYKFDKTEGKPTFYLSIGGQTVSETVSFSLNNAYRNFHDETYGGCEVADPVGPYNNNYSSHMGWPFRHFMASGTRSSIGDNNTDEGRNSLKLGLMFDMMYFKYNNVFEKGGISPSLTYDNYNKITLNQLNYEDTATVTDPNGSTHDIGTAKTMYVKDIGDYVFKISGTDKYAESSVYVSSVDLAGAPTKPIDFDGYNKLTLIDAGSNVSANVTYFSNTYELGSANVLYINGAGTYDLEMSGSNVFALSSNVVGTVTPLPTDYVKIPDIPVDIYNDSSFTRTTTSYTNSIGQTNYIGVKSSFTYNGGDYETSTDSCADVTNSTQYQPWMVFTSVVGDSTDWYRSYSYYNTANYVNVPSWIKIKIPSAKVAVGFFLKENRNTWISGFTIQGSNNDSDWTDLYTGTTVGMTTGISPTFSNSTAYQYYRLYVTSLSSSGNNYWRIDKWNMHFFGYVAPPSLTFDNYNKLTIENFTTTDIEWPPASFTSPSVSDGNPASINGITSTNSAKDAEWVISGASYGNGTYKASTTVAVHETHAVHGPFQMFNKVNGGLDTKTTTTNTSGEWTIELPSSIVLYKYSLHHGNAVSTSANYPKDWTIEGSNDGTTWVTLDTRSNETYASSVTGFDVSKREYTVSNNTTKYKHYKLNVSAINSGSYILIGAWRLFEINTRTAKLTDPNGDTYSLGQTQNDIYIKDQGDYFLEVTNSDQSAVVKTDVGTINPNETFAVNRVYIKRMYMLSPTTTGGGRNFKSITLYNGDTPYLWSSIGSSTYGGWEMYGQTTSNDASFALRAFDDDITTEFTWSHDRYSHTSSGNVDGAPAVDFSNEYAYRETNSSVACTKIRFDAGINGGGFVLVLNQSRVIYIYSETAGNTRQGVLGVDHFVIPTNQTPFYIDLVKERPSLEFDTYNKLSIENLTPISTTLKYGSNTYEIGTASNVYIEHEGTYKMATGDATTFALVSNEVDTVSSTPTYEYIGFGGMTDLNSGYTTTYSYLLKLTKADGTPLLYSDVNTFTILMDNGNGTNLDFTHIFQDTKDAIAAALGQTSTTWHGNGKLEVTALADGTALSDHATNTYIAFYFKLNEPTTIIDGASLTLHRNDKGQWKNAKAFGTNTDPSTFSSPHTPTDWTELTEVTTVDAPLGSYNGGTNPSEPWTSLGATQAVNQSALNTLSPSLTYDTSNKLSIENLTPTSTTLTDPNGSSFDIGTASNVYIRDSGKYSIASKDANTFVLTSNTVTGTPTGTTYVYDSNTFTTPSQTYDNTKTVTVSNVPSTLTDVVGKIYKGSTAYTIHTTTSSSNVIIKNTGTYVSVFTTATQAFLTNAVNVNATPTTTSDDTTIEDEALDVTSTTSVSKTIAFHDGLFADSDDPHGDGSITTAAIAGHVYSDTAPGTYTWGTLTSCVRTAMANNLYSDENYGYNNGTPPTAGFTTYKWTPPGAITNGRTLVVAGGGGGGADIGGGGGAGGLLASTTTNIAHAEQTIQVGGGGARGYDPNNGNRHAGGNGGDSSISGPGITAFGGGGGATEHSANNSNPAGSGGSGGGASGSRSNNNGSVHGTGTPGQGNNGGTSGSHWYPGGGGGAGAVGGSGNSSGHGGDGLEDDILGTNYWWAGGGGSNTHHPSYYDGNKIRGGKGGGGSGAPPHSGHGVVTTTIDTNGITDAGAASPQSANWAYMSGGSGGKHTGGGGGGGDHVNQTRNVTLGRGGLGGSGIVAIKFTTQKTVIVPGIAGSTAVPDVTTTDAPSAVLDVAAITTEDPILDLDFTTTLPRNLKRYNGLTNSSIGARFNRHESKKKRIEKSINTDTFSIELTANNASSPTTLTVTVANSKFVINGDETPTLGFIRGETYTFDQSDASNDEHPLVLATSEDGATQYTTGWVNNIFTVPYDVPDTLYYKCTNHPNMGGEINTTFGNAFSLGDFTVAANTHVSGEYTLATNYDGTTSNLYVDGALITQTTPTIASGVKEFILGKEFDGYVKNFKFWNRILVPKGIPYLSQIGSMSSGSWYDEGTTHLAPNIINSVAQTSGEDWTDSNGVTHTIWGFDLKAGLTGAQQPHADGNSWITFKPGTTVLNGTWYWGLPSGTAQSRSGTTISIYEGSSLRGRFTDTNMFVDGMIPITPNPKSMNNDT